MLSPQSAATFTEGSGKPIQPTIDCVLLEPERQPELAVRFTEIQLTLPQPEVSTPSGLASAPAREPSQHQVKSAGGPEGPVQPHVSPAGGSKGPVQPSANAGGSVGLVQPSVPPSTPPDPSPSGPRPAPHGWRLRTSNAWSVATFQAICGVIDSLLSLRRRCFLRSQPQEQFCFGLLCCQPSGRPLELLTSGSTSRTILF